VLSEGAAVHPDVPAAAGKFPDGDFGGLLVPKIAVSPQLTLGHVLARKVDQLHPRIVHLFEGVFMFARIRKALVAGLAAGAAAGIGALTIAGAPTRDEISKALGVAIVTGVGAGYATFKTRNAEAPAGGAETKPAATA
jgi:hypothetical protein